MKDASVPRQQWTLKGIATETISLVREASKAEGMKLNAWVDEALRSAALMEMSQKIGKPSDHADVLVLIRTVGQSDLDKLTCSEFNYLRATQEALGVVFTSEQIAAVILKLRSTTESPT
jgi:hypothetical protein